MPKDTEKTNNGFPDSGEALHHHFIAIFLWRLYLIGNIMKKSLDSEISSIIVQFYRESTRAIPWRKDVTPYHTWLSEIMCQQTRIETVIPYYERFISEVPDIATLAAIKEDKLYKLWQGLGYYSRARNLQKAARMIMDKYHGQFPDCYEEVIALPGIGEYTAGAILSIAFHQKYASVDGNALRVFSRLRKDRSDISLPETKNQYKEMIEKILPDAPGEFNQGVMDIGATICLPHGKPLCEKCPLPAYCQAHLSSEEECYPVKKRKIQKVEENITVFIIEENGKLLLHKRPDKGLLASLYEFKNTPGHLTVKEVEEQFKDNAFSVETGKSSDFVFTHKIWHMTSYWIKTRKYRLQEGEVFVDKNSLEKDYSLPSAFKSLIG